MPGEPTKDHDFRHLFREHVGFTWRVLRRHGVPERELEDACQEVFLVVHRRLPEFELRSSLRTWIYAIAVRVAASTRRKVHLAREALSEAAPEASFEPDLGADIDQRRQMSWVEVALGQLSSERREVFALYELEGMTVAEVGQALGIPENTALYRLYAARDEIRSFIECAQGTKFRAKSAAGRR